MCLERTSVNSYYRRAFVLASVGSMVDMWLFCIVADVDIYIEVSILKAVFVSYLLLMMLLSTSNTQPGSRSISTASLGESSIFKCIF